MGPRHRPEAWLEALGWFSLSVAFVAALAMLVDVFARGYRQRMPVMDLVYPITALYWGPVALWFYLAHGRRDAAKVIERDGPPDPGRMPGWSVLSKGVGHCGAGCTLGDIAAEWTVFALGLSFAGKALYADFLFDFVFAWLLGIVFQYFAIVPMRDIGRWRGIWAAVKADTLSIIAFQVGLFLGMWLYQEVLFSPGLPKTTAAYWMMMQLSMVLGFFTALPVNAWLIRRGWKERM
jgi:hypothetical protein